MISRLFAVLLMLTPVLATASTIDDIARLEQAKEGADAPAEPESQSEKSGPASDTPAARPQTSAAKPVWYHLSDGRRVDVGHWQIVHFVRSDCPYCHRFNPTLKSVSEQTGIGVFVYSFDGKGDAVFPKVMPVNDGILKDFFAELPQATPTDFIINTQSLVTIPLSQGEMSEEALKQRLDESFALAVRLGVL
ncbi:type-F conjugative transfer system pilin assembly thiol-disulfide isomerase TrbB [Candidatus Pantoea deserta]|uniref:Type-F conjugative transfer system pilin assembly thiol-disulfide isomerase TrbB n=1 Tax=Candidatus Pantoea deserta TaxID=1869313 RepID=A0A3N4NJQ4_9GAMM|nr:type-F conjugative transfer system pilin assembly thiol-disulfide isomerase TrbB [Pantoea deserta]RPD91749.1 type-F conjugative transfer system pilin assembly thiol-disulfide isomerase TrbB [Pantoea deserta]